MRIARWLGCFSLFLALWLLVLPIQAAPQASLTKADWQYQLHNYREALELYQHMQQKEPQKEGPRVQLQILRCYEKLKDYDGYIRTLKTALTRPIDHLWKARIFHHAAYMYQIMPHYGFKYNGQIARSEAHREGERVYLYTEDHNQASEYFLQARRQYETLFKQAMLPIPQATVYRELGAFNFDWMNFLAQSLYYVEKYELAGFPTQIAQVFNPKIPPLNQYFFLYQESRLIGQKIPEPAAVLKADSMWIGMVLNHWGYQATRYPYKDPLELAAGSVLAYPREPLAAELQLLRSEILMNRQQFTQALEQLQILIKKWPQSPFANNAKAQIQAIQWPNLQLQVKGIQPSQTRPIIHLSGRNAKQVDLQVHAVDLEKILTTRIQHSTHHFTDFTYHFGDKLSQIREHYGRKMLAWNWQPQVKPYYAFSQDMELDKPLPPGAYVVEAVADDAHSAALLVISDIVVSKTSDVNQSIYFVTDAETGKPISPAKVWLKEIPYYNNQYQPQVTTTTSNELGLVVHHPQKSMPTTSYIEALVRHGDHYAVTGLDYWSRYYSNENTCRVFSSTDRPIYRPGQKVSFRHLFRHYHNGTYTNVTGIPIRLRIFDARGNEIYKKELTTDRFGSIHDHLQLGQTPPLGRYYASMEFVNSDDKARLGNYLNLSGGYQFQVEEYKRPEYKVTVVPPTDAPRPGETTQITIRADYFFGAPVTQGMLKYRIFKKVYYPYFAPSYHPYRWLYGDDMMDYRGYYYDSDNRTLLKQAEIPLSTTGQTKVAFPTDKSTVDMVYEVEAEVVDASRRMVSGSGSVKVTHQSYYAQIGLKRGFYGPGDRVDAEIQLVDLNGRPVKTTAKLMIQEIKGQKEEQVREISNETISSDAEGRVFYRWTPPAQARYRMTFLGRDRYEREVKAAQDVWVVGDQFEGQHYKFQNVEILTDQRVYEPGQTVQVLLNTAFPDSYILLFESAGEEILHHQLLHVPNHSRVVPLKLQAHHLPNFNLKAVVVQHRALHEDNRELFVPPAQQFLNVKLSRPQTEFQPGAKATLGVEVTDHQGSPVETLLALGITDASLYEMQADLTGDIRKFYFGGRRPIRQSMQASFGQSFSTLAQVLRKQIQYQTQGYTHLRPGGRYRNVDGEGFATTGLAAPEQPKPAPMAQATDALAKDESKSVREAERDERADDDRKGKKEEQQAQNAPVQLRTNFAETAYWNPLLVTDAQGKATVEVTFPDSLTTWKINTHGITAQTQVGQAADQVVTTKKILVRLQAPRFFTERDEVLLSANINNQYEQAQEVKAEIQLDPKILALQTPPAVTVQVAGKGEARVDWKVKVLQEGQARIVMKALNVRESDAVQMDFPVYVHGIDKTVMRNGVMREQNSVKETLALPAERKPGSTQLKLTLNPSLAGTLLEALPYLAEYPYGCVEQTTSRFVPAVLVAHTLQKSGVSLKDLGQQRNLNADKLSVRVKNPVFDKTELDQMVQEGLKKLYQFQRSDGGWGWWYGTEYSDPYMTAYVLYALQLAAKTDYTMDSSVISRGLDYLRGQFKQEKSLHLKAYQAFVLALSQSGRLKTQELEDLFVKRDQLNHYSKALLALAYHYLGDKAKAELICHNLRSFIQVDQSNGTASVPSENTYWWYWYGDRVETNAFVLKAYANILPKDPMVPMLVRWLVFNRESNRWTSTKDTAQVIYAMMDYLKQSGELAPNYALTVKVNDKVIKNIAVNAQNALTFANQVVLSDNDLRSGENTLVIEKQGSGNLYYSAQLAYFTLEENIKGAGNEIGVKREYFRVNGQTVASSPLKEGEVLTSGDEIEVKLTVKSQNDYEYLIFEDRKPAGCEAIDKKSGYVYQNGVYLNRELRDAKVVFFLDDLPQGTQVLTYRLRAEIPGVFHALPHQAGAMYAPKVQAISDEALIHIRDK